MNLNTNEDKVKSNNSPKHKTNLTEQDTHYPSYSYYPRYTHF